MIHVEPTSSASALDGLALSERFVLWNFRAWACCCRGQRLPAEPVVSSFTRVGAPEAATALDAAMTRLVLATARPLAVSCPPHPGLSEDERRLVAATAAAQRHDRGEIARLFADLLPAPAVAAVSRALVDLGGGLAMVGILLPQPGPEAPVAVPDGWLAQVPATLH